MQPDVSKAGLYYGITTPVFALAIFISSLRIYRRVIMKQLGLDDLFLVITVVSAFTLLVLRCLLNSFNYVKRERLMEVSQILVTVGFILNILKIENGVGRHIQYLSQKQIENANMYK
jgi:hypothetical protein